MSEVDKENQESQQDKDEPISLGILQFSYETLLKTSFQTVIATFEELISSQLTEENTSRINFEILSKKDEESSAHSLFLDVSNIQEKIEKVCKGLRKLNQEEVSSKSDWERAIKIPFETDNESLETLLNTDSVFCYLASQYWFEYCIDQENPFLFHRTDLQTELRVNEEEKTKEIIFCFKYVEPPQPEPEEPEEVESQERSLHEETAPRFMQTKEKTIRKTAKDMKVPQKYNSQRRPPQEVPLDVIKALFLAIDQDMDDKISAYEILKYIHKTKLTINDEIAQQLFDEWIQRRSVVHEKQRNLPLLLDEVVAAIRGRHKWNTEEKRWEVAYRPMREYWIILLQTISSRIFTVPIPQVKPKKILAQYEINDMMKDEWKKSKVKNEGTVKKYETIDDVVEPTYKREINKPNDKYKLDFVERERTQPGFNPYEYQINRRIKTEKNEDNKEYPKIDWEARAFYEMSLQISKQDPKWGTEDKNPIMYYNPTRQLPEGVDLPLSKYEPKDQYPTQRFENTENMENKEATMGDREDLQDESERSLDDFSRDQGATMNNLNPGTMTNQMALETVYRGKKTFTKSHEALAQFKKTQIGKGKKRTEVAGLQNPEPTTKPHGFRTRFILNDLFTDKAVFARNARNSMNEEKKEKFVPNEFEPYKDPVFRDLDLPFGKKELNLLYKCPKAENQYNLSEHNTKPKMVQDVELKEREALEATRKEEYEKALKGDKPRPKDLTWNQFLHVPDKLKPIATGLKEQYLPKKNKVRSDKEFFEKDPYGDETALLVMSRQMRENEVFGKPNMNLYFKPTKARDEDIDVEFGRVTKKYKTIY